MGCLVSLIKGHFKGMLKELKKKKAQKGKNHLDNLKRNVYNIKACAECVVFLRA